MSFLYLAGRYFNLLSRPSATLTATPSAAAAFPVTALGDNDPSSPCIHGSAAADSEIRYEGLAVNGGFESDLTGWTSADSGGGASTITTTAGEFRTGAKALKCVIGAGYAGRYQDFIVAAGEVVKISVYARAVGGDTAALYVTNMTTGYYLDASGLWAVGSHASGETRTATNTAAAFTQLIRTVTVQSFEVSRADYHTIRVEIGSLIGTSYFDDFEFLPGVTFASIHGHNLGPMMAPTVQSSDDASSWTTRGTMTVKRGAFFVTFANVHARYWRFKYDGASSYANATAPYIGEAVLGTYQTSATSPQWGIPKTRSFPGVRTRSAGARHHVYNFAVDPPQDIEATFSARSAADAAEIDALWLRSAQGQNPTIFVPIDTETDVYYGRLIEPHTVARPFTGVYDCTLRLMGDPFPTIGL